MCPKEMLLEVRADLTRKLAIYPLITPGIRPSTMKALPMTILATPIQLLRQTPRQAIPFLSMKLFLHFLPSLLRPRISPASKEFH